MKYQVLTHNQADVPDIFPTYVHLGIFGLRQKRMLEDIMKECSKTYSSEESFISLYSFGTDLNMLSTGEILFHSYVENTYTSPFTERFTIFMSMTWDQIKAIILNKIDPHITVMNVKNEDDILYFMPFQNMTIKINNVEYLVGDILCLMFWLLVDCNLVGLIKSFGTDRVIDVIGLPYPDKLTNALNDTLNNIEDEDKRLYIMKYKLTNKCEEFVKLLR